VRVQASRSAALICNLDGRVSFSVVGEEVQIKYQLLNPATHFKEVVDVAGGTMAPVRTMFEEDDVFQLKFRHQISDVTTQLFPYLPTEKVSIFSCGHIIPKTNMTAVVLAKGPSSGVMEYKMASRNNAAQVVPIVLGDAGELTNR
jgi:chromosome transmission fidelity protein 1